MAISYVTLVNNILESLNWNTVAAADFDSPGNPATKVKRFVNEAKDETLHRLGLDLTEQDLQFETGEMISSDVNTQDLFITGTTVSCLSALFGTVTVGYKMICDLRFSDDDGFSGSGTGLTDDTPHRVTATTSGTTFTVDRRWTAQNAQTPDEWKVYKDEYDLDATVRQVTSMYHSDGPLDLKFTTVDDLRRLYPNPSFGTPREAAVFRSSTSGSIWQVQLYPAPTERTIIRYRAVTRVPDLSSSSDTWELEDEVVRMIQDRATYKALLMPSPNNDPELAVVINRDLSARVDDYVNAMTPRDPGRRRRRLGPNGASDGKTVRMGWNIENPTA